MKSPRVKPIGRARRVTGWALTALGALLSAAWLWPGSGVRVAHGWGRWEWAGGCFVCTVGEGEALEWHDVFWSRVRAQGLLPRGERPWSRQRGFTPDHPSYAEQFSIALWAPVALSLGAGTVLLGAWRRDRPGRRRLVAGLAATVVGLGATGGWVASGWGCSQLNLAPVWLTQVNGVVRVDVDGVDEQAGRATLARAEVQQAIVPRPGVNLGTSGGWLLWSWSLNGRGVAAPTWPFAMGLTWGGLAVARSGWRLRGRPGAGLCAGCGYDLRGLSGRAKCPECGIGGGA
jgi:hypothetical protein